MDGRRLRGDIRGGGPASRCGRVELSLKLAAPGAADLADLAEGDTVRGTVRRVEHFGLFVRLEGSSLTGLAHKSQLADGFVADMSAAFQVGQGAPAPCLPGSPPCSCTPPPSLLPASLIMPLAV